MWQRATLTTAVVALSLFAQAAWAADPVPPGDTRAGEATTAPSTQPADEASTWPPGVVMDVLSTTSFGKSLKDLQLRFYGFAEAGFTGRLTGGQDPLPFRNFEARHPNHLRFDVLSLTAERTNDTSKSFDFGGKVEGLFGGDAKLTHSRGLFEHAGHGDTDLWADLFQLYGTVYVKTGNTSGLEILVGKFGTSMGFEPTEAVSPLGPSPMYSHSFLFSALPFTHTGVRLTYTIDPQLSINAGIVKGWDVFDDNNDGPSFMAGAVWQSAEKVGSSSKHAVYFNFMTGPEQDNNSRDYRTTFDASYTLAWSEKLSQSINADFGFEDGAGLNGQTDRWYGIAHYLTYTFNDYVSSAWRAEWFRNEHGSRIGFAGNLYETTLSATVTPWPGDKILKNLAFRPEFRWDFAGKPAFGDDHHSQLTAAMDVVFKF